MIVTDLRHFEGIGLTANPPRGALRMAEYLGRIVGAASVREAGREEPTALPCRRRPGRSRCTGRLAVRRIEVPNPEIDWRCPACDESGLIHGWSGSVYDLSNASQVMEGPAVLALVPAFAYPLLLDSPLLDHDCQRLILRALPSDEWIEISGNAEDVEHLMESVAADANHSPRPRQRQLDAVYALLDTALSIGASRPG